MTASYCLDAIVWEGFEIVLAQSREMCNGGRTSEAYRAVEYLGRIELEDGPHRLYAGERIDTTLTEMIYHE